jgi:tetratricopeptide (TPR) repeat protein
MPYKKRTKIIDPEGEESPEGPTHIPHKTSYLVEAPIYALIFFVPLAIGTVHLWSKTVMLGLAVLAFCALAFRRRRQARSFLLFPMGIALLSACVFCLLQLVPMPEFMVRLLNPGAAGLYDFVLSGTGLWGEGNFRALSLDPPGTAIALVSFLAYALAFIVVVNYFNDRRRARRLLKLIAWAGFSVALIGFFSKLFVAKSILGFHPVAQGTFFFSTFVNPNHLAGFLGLCSPVALGLGMSARERQDKALYGFMGVISGVAVFMSLSRGGIVALLAGLAFLFVFIATRRARRLRHATLVQTSVAAVLILAGYLAYDTVISELKTLGDLEAVREETKVRSWGATFPMMADHPVVGIGKGAYQTVYPQYKTIASDRTFTHAENQVLQLMVEWGPGFGFLFIGMFILAFILAVSRARQSLTMGGCLAGVFVVAVHNLVDFNLEIGGVALIFVLVLGVLSASPFSHAGKPREIETRLRLPGWVAKVLAPVVLVVAGLCVPYSAAHDLDEHTTILLEAPSTQVGEPCDQTAMGQAACELMEYHPADYMAALVVGRALLEKTKPPKADRAMHWLSRALYLNPTLAVIHQLAGRGLYLAGHKDQALGEYRVAADLKPSVLTATTMEVLRLSGDTDQAIAATPQDGDSLLKVAKILRNLGKQAAAGKAAQMALEKDSGLTGALDLLADQALAAGRYEEVAGLARQLAEIDPLHDRAYFLQGLVLLKQDKPGEAEKAWQAGITQVPDSTLLAYRLVELYLSQARFAEAEGVASRLQNFAPSSDSAQARLHLLLGRISEAKGMLFEARRSYRMATQLAPSVLPYQYRLGLTEERMGNWDEAANVYRKLQAARFRVEEMKKRLEKVAAAKAKEKDRAMYDTWVKEKPESE